MNKKTRMLVKEEILSQIALHNEAVDSMIKAGDEYNSALWEHFNTRRNRFLHAIRCMINLANDVDSRFSYRIDFESCFICSHCFLIVEKVEG